MRGIEVYLAHPTGKKHIHCLRVQYEPASDPRDPDDAPFICKISLVWWKERPSGETPHTRQLNRIKLRESPIWAEILSELEKEERLRWEMEREECADERGR